MPHQPLITLESDRATGVIRADIAPSRGMMLLQARARLSDGREFDMLHAPPLTEALRRLQAGGEEDFAGNESFSFGGAILLPFANRIRGRPVGDRELAVEIDGQTVRLPRNWGGRAAGAEQYAMHGLILAAAPAELRQPAHDRVTARIGPEAFAGEWPSAIETLVTWSLEDGALSLSVTATNVGAAVSPVGIGWHPYFALPSGDRRQARLYVPAAGRLEVNDYDEVLPTGRILPTAGAAFDFSKAGGAALGDLYLDDCFMDLSPASDQVVAELVDPAARYGLRLGAAAPVRAVQVYAPTESGFVVIEPQFNFADPFSGAWKPETDTGMIRLAPGEATTYVVRLSSFGAPSS